MKISNYPLSLSLRTHQNMSREIVIWQFHKVQFKLNKNENNKLYFNVVKSLELN